MTSTLDDARGEMLARAKQHASKWRSCGRGSAEMLAAFAKNEAARAAPVPQCGAPRRMHDSSTGESYWQNAKGEQWEGSRCDAESAKALAAFRQNLQEAWAAMAMIRETIETLGPVGAVKASEHLDGPTFMHEAEALVAGITALAVSSACSPMSGLSL